MPPVVSVIIPTYNHQDFVIPALESVFAQSFTDHEVIVVNDGSPDHTDDLLRPLRDSGRIRYIEQANGGQSAARNRGLREAQGEFVAFLDDDDRWPVDKLEWQVAELASAPEVALVYGYAQIVDDAGGTIRRQPEGPGPEGRVFQALAKGGFIRSPGQTLLRRELLLQLGGFDERLWGVDDWDLFLRLATKGPFRYVDRSSLLYREHGGNASLQFARMYRNALQVRDRHFQGGDRDLFLTCDRTVRNFTTWDGLRAADEELSRGRRATALRALLALIVISRFQILPKLQLRTWARLLSCGIFDGNPR